MIQYSQQKSKCGRQTGAASDTVYAGRGQEA